MRGNYLDGLSILNHKNVGIHTVKLIHIQNKNRTVLIKQQVCGLTHTELIATTTILNTATNTSALIMFRLTNIPARGPARLHYFLAATL